jgi:hypothetical protein
MDATQVMENYAGYSRAVTTQRGLILQLRAILMLAKFEEEESYGGNEF